MPTWIYFSFGSVLHLQNVYAFIIAKRHTVTHMQIYIVLITVSRLKAAGCLNDTDRMTSSRKQHNIQGSFEHNLNLVFAVKCQEVCVYVCVCVCVFVERTSRRKWKKRKLSLIDWFYMHVSAQRPAMPQLSFQNGAAQDGVDHFRRCQAGSTKSKSMLFVCNLGDNTGYFCQNSVLLTETWLNPSKADHSIKPIETLFTGPTERLRSSRRRSEVT